MHANSQQPINIPSCNAARHIGVVAAACNMPTTKHPPGHHPTHCCPLPSFWLQASLHTPSEHPVLPPHGQRPGAACVTPTTHAPRQAHRAQQRPRELTAASASPPRPAAPGCSRRASASPTPRPLPASCAHPWWQGCGAGEGEGGGEMCA